MIYLPIEQYTNNIKTQYTRWAFPVHNAEITSCYYVSDAYCINCLGKKEGNFFRDASIVK